MRFNARISILVLIAGAIVAISAPAAAQAAFGIEKFESLSCTENAPEGKPKECSSSTPAQFFKQAGGHPNFGVTDFTFNEFGTAGNGVKTIRTDLPVGFSTNPQALPQCSMVDFEENLDLEEENHCGENTEAGVQEITLVLPGPTIVNLTGTVYNLAPAKGLPLEFGIDLELPFLGHIHVHSFLEGGVSWHKEAEATAEGIASGDYHEYFKIKIAKSISEGEAPLLRSRLVFNGKAGIGLLTNPTACPGPQTTHLRVESYSGAVAYSSFASTPTAAEENCGILNFEPAFSLTPSSSKSDASDGVTTELKFPQNESSSEIENSDLKTSTVTLPPGLTINPAAASGLEACTPEDLGIGTEKTTVSCPPRSVIGSDVLDVPGLPPESLRGNVYLGETAPGPITGPPYKIYVEATSARYGQTVRLEGTVVPNLTTGQLTTTFANNPQGPFTDLKLAFNGGPFANLANPLTCATATTEAIFASYSGKTHSPLLPQFSVEGCASSPPPFSPTQSTAVSPISGGTDTGFTFNLARPEGTQYVEKVRTVLPPGVVGKIPTVPLCAEPQAAATQVSGNGCPSASQIGTVNVTAGSGEPYPFTGTAYLTGPYEGAPYGLAFKVPVVAGPFNLGEEITRAKIEVEPYSSRVIVTSTLPTIRDGIPVRLRSLTVNINRPNYLLNPTNCQLEAVESTLTSTLAATANLSTPFQAEGCSTLGFKPSFSAKTTGKTSKANGASLETTINQPAGQANLKSVLVTLPKQLPSRLTTLQKACPETTFAANPYTCPPGSFVGAARANTPTLPGKLQGPAIFVSHGGAAFPDLDLVMEANGIRVIVVGNTKITNGVTTTNFATTPDVPVSSVTVVLPTGPNSALAANGNLCVTPLVMPTTITGQNGLVVKQNTKIAVTGCGVQIVGHKVIGDTAYLTIKTFAAGRITASGSSLSSASRTLNGASNATTLKIPLSSGGRGRRRPFSTKIRVGFVPKSRSVGSSTATVSVRF